VVRGRTEIGLESFLNVPKVWQGLTAIRIEFHTAGVAELKPREPIEVSTRCWTTRAVKIESYEMVSIERSASSIECNGNLSATNLFSGPTLNYYMVTTLQESTSSTFIKVAWCSYIRGFYSLPRKKCRRRVSNTARGRWRRQHKTELDGDEWSVAYMLHCEQQGIHQVSQVKSTVIIMLYPFSNSGATKWSFIAMNINS